jgi:hypothetical protein
MIEKSGYSRIRVGIADTPTAGHELIMLDYRACGKRGEPQVVYVDQEDDYSITFVAPDFETFIRGLVEEAEYDTAEDAVMAEGVRPKIKEACLDWAFLDGGPLLHTPPHTPHGGRRDPLTFERALNPQNSPRVLRRSTAKPAVLPTLQTLLPPDPAKIPPGLASPIPSTGFPKIDLPRSFSDGSQTRPQ